LEKTMPREMLIGALADAANVGIETICFYEREGLLRSRPEVTHTSSFEDLADRVRQEIIAVEGRIRELSRVRHVLHGLVEACAARVETSECPILEVLDDHKADE